MMSDLDRILETLSYPVHEALNNYELIGAQIARLLGEAATKPLSPVDPARQQAEASIGAAALALAVFARRFGISLEGAVATNVARINGARSGGLLMAMTAERETKEQSDER